MGPKIKETIQQSKSMANLFKETIQKQGKSMEDLLKESLDVIEDDKADKKPNVNVSLKKVNEMMAAKKTSTQRFTERLDEARNTTDMDSVRKKLEEYYKEEFFCHTTRKRSQSECYYSR